MKPRVRISVIKDLGTHLNGYVYNHPKFLDGDRVFTSDIVTRHADGSIETLSAIYEVLPPESLF